MTIDDISERLSRRDYHILRYLIDGAETFGHIQEHLKSIKEKLLGYEHKIQSYEMKNVNLRSKLARLQKQGLIRSKRYRKLKGPGVFSLYVITEEGFGELIRSNLNVEYCRMSFPGRYTVSHDLQVVSVLRKCRHELMSNEIPHAIEDENDMRKKSKGRSKAIPDLHLKIIFPLPGGKRKTQEIALEIDNDTISPLRVAEKVDLIYKNKGWPILLLCWKGKRREDLLRRYSLLVQGEAKKAASKQASKEAIDKIYLKYNRFFVADLYDFIYKGLLGTEWTRADGSSAFLVEQDKKKS